MSEEDGEQSALQDIEWCTNLQCLIEISAEHLEGLRTQCLTRAVLTQQEIRRIEAKLVKLFSTQLVAKSRIPSEELVASGCDHYPSLQLWLKVVGLSPATVQMVCRRYASMEALMESGEAELRALLPAAGAEDDVRRLARAMHNMKKYTESQQVGDSCSSPDLPLYWDSWEAASPSPRRRPRSSVSSSDETQQSESSAPTPSESSVHSQPTPTALHELTQSLPAPGPSEPSPPHTPPAGRAGRDGATPSSSRRHGLREPPPAASGGEPASLTKSRSHESQLTGRAETAAGEAAAQARTEGELYEVPEPAARSPGVAASPAPSSAAQTPTKSTSLQAPRSPHTPTLPGSMSHTIAHKFAKTFKVSTSTCDFCHKQMIIVGLRCRECKYKCHRHCEELVPPSCGLPRKALDYFMEQVNSQSGDRLHGNASPLVASRYQGKSQSSGFLHHRPAHNHGYTNSSISISAFQGQDSSSNTSSCNSSNPSSPAFLLTTSPASASRLQRFNFPEVAVAEPVPGVTVEPLPTPPPPPSPPPPAPVPAPQPAGVGSQDSDKTMSQTSASTSTDSERTVASRLDSQDSTVSETDGLPRQNSLSLREWDIPFEEVRLGDVIGRGRFGVVKKGHWHGEVAVKLLNMEDDDALEQFKRDVATFRKTRHENLVLFMGACMCPPQLAIITSFCKGKPLFNLLHVHKEKFNLTKISNIAKHISLGMGYLHARGIVHKDLKSKNIFVDGSGTVVITDFGLFSLTKLCPNLGYRHRLHIPKGWLCYLSPEIVRCLRPGDNRDLPFSMSSDIFAFGTVWYELLSGEWPWKDQPAEATIWLVGRGMKQSLANIQASRDVKDLLMKCWNYHQSDRPDFTQLLSILERLPKKRLARSPSHPIQLSRSVESVF